MHLHGRGERYKPEAQGYEENGPWQLSPQKEPEGENIGNFGIM
jgi:hypothetical protein